MSPPGKKIIFVFKNLRICSLKDVLYLASAIYIGYILKALYGGKLLKRITLKRFKTHQVIEESLYNADLVYDCLREPF
jgi:hypothetical protein